MCGRVLCELLSSWFLLEVVCVLFTWFSYTFNNLLSILEIKLSWLRFRFGDFSITTFSVFSGSFYLPLTSEIGAESYLSEFVPSPLGTLIPIFNFRLLFNRFLVLDDIFFYYYYCLFKACPISRSLFNILSYDLKGLWILFIAFRHLLLFEWLGLY